MAHLVTGYAGTEHIQSADQGSFNAAFFGAGQFVMEIGNVLSASIITNNTVRVLDGDLLMHGRHIRINSDTYEDLTIQNGTAGKNRIDLIVMTYEKDTSSGVETAYLEVIKGTDAAGTASEPSYISGNILDGALKNQMPLYAVCVEGVVLSNLKRKFTTCPTYKTLAERYEAEFISTCNNYLNSLNILDSSSSITGNTLSNQLAGALGVKALYDSLNSKKANSSHTHTKSQITDFAHTHTKSQITDFSHTHDDRYYTETEVKSLFNNLFKTKEFKTTKSFPAYSISVTNFNVELSGYTPIAIYKANAGFCLSSFILDGTEARIQTFNPTSTGTSSTSVLVGVLYKKNM